MMTKKPKEKASFKLVKVVFFLIRILPVRCMYGFCNFTVFMGSRLKWRRKLIALNNLKLVFPEKSEGERKYIFRESLRNMLKYYYELIIVITGKYSSDKISEWLSASGLEYLDELVKKEQGALLYSGHFGNFPLMLIWLAQRGYPIAAVYKEAGIFPDGFYTDIVRKLNITPLKYTSDTSITIAIIRALKENKIVFIQNDQSHPNGIFINFFNKSVPSPAGPALLAKRVGVPLIPCYVCREKNNHHHITILPEIPLQQEEDPKKFLQLNTQIQIDWIAQVLVEHPTEWLWMHNRWKRAVD